MKPAGRGGAAGSGASGGSAASGVRRRAPGAEAGAVVETPPETLFLATIPGATPSTWVRRFTSRERAVQLVNHDEAAQFAHLRHDAAGTPLHALPQLGYVRWRRDRDLEDVLAEAGVDPRHVHTVTSYSELPVVCVGRDHLLAAWDAVADGPVPVGELDPEEELDPARFGPEPGEDPLESAELPGAGERMAIEIAASGAGHVVLPMSVARMFGRKDVVVLPLASALDDVVGLSRADREAAATEAELEADPSAGPASDIDVPPAFVHDMTPSSEALVHEIPGSSDAFVHEIPGSGDDVVRDVRHPGWDVGLAWLKENDSPLVQTFIGVSRGRRASSSR